MGRGPARGESYARRPNGVRMSDNPNALRDIEGQVKWFDPRKGFGFIVGPDGQDIFVHFTVIEGDGFRVLRDGSAVVYDADRSDKGWRATRVARSEVQEEEVPEVVVPRRTYSRSPRR